ncbi:glycosyltransferase family 4 protein [Flavobacterium sp. UMI-01]|uniref:glycosyltransferase family 4 protein n=1 Tax=Flavobacterium sp. UMI-01 TaxID=1441053 RepID=UPI001C7D0D87|nr:glycosyltransferase family 4 protein [Flavobacterium sp. UMI-01]GIZ08244.1 glycoside hydrolase [Flavobacterium sp. UMI-01]
MKTQQHGINIIGYTESEFGLGEAVRLNCKAARKKNIPLCLIDYDQIKRNPNYQYRFDYAVNLVQIALGDLESFFANIDSNLFKNRYTILFLVWESEYIAPEIIPNLQLFNEIWTTSEYCKSIFKKVFTDPIIVVPHPIEMELIANPTKNTTSLFNPNAFSFLFVFSYHSSIERKNPFFLIEAFKTAFGNNNQVELVIKTVGGHQYKKAKQRLLKSTANATNIKIIDQEMDKKSVNELIHACDAYVSLHHSEGFGLTLAEAMFFGKPTIATNYSGNTEFMTTQNSYLVDYELGFIENPDHNFCANTLWANPILEDAVAKLKAVYEKEEQRTDKATLASLQIKEQLSFESIGNIIFERISYLYTHFDKVVTKQSQYNYFLNQLYCTKAENAKLKREIRRMKKNLIIRFIVYLKDTTRKVKSKIKS